MEIYAMQMNIQVLLRLWHDVVMVNNVMDTCSNHQQYGCSDNIVCAVPMGGHYYLRGS